MPELRRAGGQHRAAPRRHPDAHPRQGRAAQGRRVHRRSDAARAREFPSRREAGRHRHRGDRPRRPTSCSATSRRRQSRRSATSRRARRISAPAARSVRCSPRSSSPSARSAARTSRPTSAAIRSRPSRRSRMGNSILGYGMSLASAAAVAPNVKSRPISVMGDGGFWHNGLITGVASNLFNKNDGVLIVMQNGYTSATGQQYMPSSATSRQGTAPGMDDRADAALVRRQMAAQGAHLQRRHDGEDPEGGDAHAGRGAQGHHRGRRMPARAPAPRARRGRREAESRRARGAHQVRRRRRDLHRRPFLHPSLRLPVAHREALARSAAHRSGRRRDRDPASAAGCAARSRMRRCCARRSIAPR